MGSPSGYQFDSFLLNLDRLSVQEHGSDLELRPKAFEVLRMLVENAGKVLSKDELVAAVWPGIFVNDDALAQCVRDIRKALGDDEQRYIRTVPRRGYIFVAEVTPAGGAPETVPADKQRVSAPLRRGGPFLLGAAFVVLIAVLAAWNAPWRNERIADDIGLTVAVLPFSGSPEDEWLGDGLAEDIMTAVSRFRDLTVIARNSSFRFRGDNQEPRAIGAALNADYLLQGTVRRLDGRLRITAQIVDAKSGEARWTQRYDRELVDFFALQDEVAEAVAAQLAVHAREAELSRLRVRVPQSLEAYELVLRGRKIYANFTREGIFEAHGLAEQAIATDETYAPAWELLAATRLQFFYQPYDDNFATPAMLKRAREAAERAVSLDPNFATAHAMLAATLVPARETEAALAYVEKALSLNPNDAVATSVHGNVLTFLARYEEAVAAWEWGERVDPFTTPMAYALRAIPLIMLGRNEEALVSLRTCAERVPRLQPCLIYLAVALNELGRTDEASATVRTLLDINPRFSVSTLHGLQSYSDEAERERLASMMRSAGLPG